MPAFLHFEELHATGDVHVGACRCRPGSTARGGEERSSENSIVFVRRGAFLMHTAGERFTADANTVVFFRRGETYQVGHLDTSGDDCTILRVGDADLLDAARAHDPAAEDPACPVRFTHGVSGPAADLLHRRLHRALRGGPQDPVAVAEVVFDLVDAAVAASASVRGALRRPGLRPATAWIDRERVEAARAILARRFSEKVRLAEVARAAGCSAYHLSRLFRRETGQTARSYLTRLRLRAALDALLEGERDLGAVAVESGFYDQSHLTNAFSRAFHLPPAALRRGLGNAALREIRAACRLLDGRPY